MNVIGEYILQYNIFTMFDVYTVKIKNHNLITELGYEFFLKKWYKDDATYPIKLGYYHDNHFYEQKNIDDSYDYDLKESNYGEYSKTTNYIDKDTYKQYWFNGEEFVDFYEKIDKICIGDYVYIDEDRTKPSIHDTELYSPVKEYKIVGDGFIMNSNKLLMRCEINREELNGTTEIGIKTSHGRLVSHDIHAPYNLPFGTNISLEYIFKL